MSAGVYSVLWAYFSPRLPGKNPDNDRAAVFLSVWRVFGFCLQEAPFVLSVTGIKSAAKTTFVAWSGLIYISLSCFCSASGASVVAIDNKIEQAMVRKKTQQQHTNTRKRISMQKAP